MPYLPILTLEIMIVVIFATSLQLLMGAGGMHSFRPSQDIHSMPYASGAFATVLGFSPSAKRFSPRSCSVKKAI